MSTLARDRAALPNSHRSCLPLHQAWMSPRRLLLSLGLFLLAGLVQAQITNPEVFYYIPDPPEANRVFTLVLRVDPCGHGTLLLNTSPQDREIIVSPGRIELYVLNAFIAVCQPGLVPHDNAIQIEPVAAGTYEVIVIGRHVSYPDDPTFNVPLYQTSLTVVPQSLAISRPVAVPSLSGSALGWLAGLMLLLGAWAWRRHS